MLLGVLLPSPFVWVSPLLLLKSSKAVIRYCRQIAVSWPGLRELGVYCLDNRQLWTANSKSHSNSDIKFTAFPCGHDRIAFGLARSFHILRASLRCIWPLEIVLREWSGERQISNRTKYEGTQPRQAWVGRFCCVYFGSGLWISSRCMIFDLSRPFVVVQTCSITTLTSCNYRLFFYCRYTRSP